MQAKTDPASKTFFMTEKEKMLSGELYNSLDEELQRESRAAKNLTRLFNQTTEEEQEYRAALLRKLFEKTGKIIRIEPPFHCDYGYNIRIGENFYANYDCIILDTCEVIIGDNVLLGPRVGIYTAGHPVDPATRNLGLEYGKPVRIGNNVWIGAHTIVNPGVVIGDNVVIGSGSVVTRDIPDNVVAVGNPCRVLRSVTDALNHTME